MNDALIYAMMTVTHNFMASVAQSPMALLLVAGYAGASLALYGLTRGREFLVAGYSSVLFLAPFVHVG